MSAITMFLAFVVLVLIVVDVALYQSYWYLHAEKYGYSDYSAAMGFYMFYKVEFGED